MRKYKVFIVDDHPIVRQGLKQLINQEADFRVCGEAESAHAALEKIPTFKPDIIIVDITLKGISGLELIKDIKIRFKKMPVLVFSIHDESLYAERVLRAGARGYIIKQEASEKVIMAMRKIIQGEIYVSDKMVEKMLKQIADGRAGQNGIPIEKLSDRELEVFQLIGQGHGTRQIAKKLNLSVKTIEAHRVHIKKKMNFKTAIELHQHAIQWIQSHREE